MDLNELIFIFIATLALTLLIEMPTRNLRKAILNGEHVAKKADKMCEHKAE